MRKEHDRIGDGKRRCQQRLYTVWVGSRGTWPSWLLSRWDNCTRILIWVEFRWGESVFYRRVAAAALITVGSISLASARDLALVANKANSVTAVALPELVKICKAQTNRWADGKPVTLIMRAPANPEMKLLLEKVYELSQAQVTDLIASANHGRMNHPAILVVDSDEELVNKVASIPGAIGVVDVYAINSSVAVVKVGGKLPLQPGYLLHGN